MLVDCFEASPGYLEELGPFSQPGRDTRPVEVHALAVIAQQVLEPIR